MEKKFFDFIQTNSPDGGFLQSVYWRNFQEAVGRKTFELEEKDENGDTLIYAYVIVHKLPIVGNYFYVPRGPILSQKSKVKSQNYISKVKIFFEDLINLSKNNNIGWIRIELNSEEDLKLVKENLPKGLKMKKSAADVQPKEILVMDISGGEEEILSEMKQKTRYNIRLAEKKGVEVFATHEKKYINEFLHLVKITSERDRITAHPESYYRKMFEIIPPEVLKLYVAEFDGKIIAANLVLFFGHTATYMHGASGDQHREVMAPYLLQWQQIRDAKKAGCERYDFGGVGTMSNDQESKIKSWEGITRFKTGFAPETKPVCFPGCYDIVLNPARYVSYRILRKIKP